MWDLTLALNSFVLLLIFNVSPANAGAVCNTTLVKAYQGQLTLCGAFGRLRRDTPSDLIQKFPAGTFATDEGCAEQCLNNPSCLTFRHKYISQDRYRCFLYSSYLEDMGFDDGHYDYSYNDGDGDYFDRDCFSNDCSIINTCTRSMDCWGSLYNYGTFHYKYVQYACETGMIARPLKTRMRVAEFPGRLPVCKAIVKCRDALIAGMQSYYDATGYRSGSFNVFYSIPSKTWVCNQFDDQQTEFVYEPYDFDDRKTHTGRDRFTVANASVGDSYGYYLYEAYYTD